jgi:hypothetical protein
MSNGITRNRDMEFCFGIAGLQFRNLGKVAALEVRCVWTSAEAAFVSASEHRLFEGHSFA